MKLEFIKDGVLDLSVLEKVMCKCGHSMMFHYYGEGCCDRSLCWCKKFEFEPMVEDKIPGHQSEIQHL